MMFPFASGVTVASWDHVCPMVSLTTMCTDSAGVESTAPTQPPPVSVTVSPGA